MSPVTNNPNAEVSVYTGALTIIIVWAVQVTGLLEVPDYVAQAFTVVLTGAALWAGRRKKTDVARPESVQ